MDNSVENNRESSGEKNLYLAASNEPANTASVRKRISKLRQKFANPSNLAFH